jgi:hypothetical protein
MEYGHMQGIQPYTAIEEEEEDFFIPLLWSMT